MRTAAGQAEEPGARRPSTNMASDKADRACISLNEWTGFAQKGFQVGARVSLR
jgi:hypothetical protein